MLPIKCSIMKKNIFHEERVQGTWLLGSKSRCSISSRRVVLYNYCKVRKPLKIGALLKKIGCFCLKVFGLIRAFGKIAELATFIINRLGW